mgnify:FL=1
MFICVVIIIVMQLNLDKYIIYSCLVITWVNLLMIILKVLNTIRRRNMKKITVKLMKVCGPLVLSVVFLSSESTSIWHIHQSQKPAKLKNANIYSKFYLL